MKEICNKNCFVCPHPDCVNDVLDWEDYVALEAMEREYMDLPKKDETPARIRQKITYEKSIDKRRAYARAYARTHRSARNDYRKQYYEANKDRAKAYQREYDQRKKTEGRREVEYAT